MAIDGIWALSVVSPMGTQDSTLDIRCDGNALAGTQADQRGVHPIKDGTVDGAALSWSLAITVPVAMTLVFRCIADGDRMTGKVKAGFFGTFEVTGRRATGEPG